MKEDERGELLVAFRLGLRCAQSVLNCRDDVATEALKLLLEVAAGRQTMLDSPRGMTDEDAGENATKAVAGLLEASASLRTEQQVARRIVGLESGEAAESDDSEAPA